MTLPQFWSSTNIGSYSVSSIHESFTTRSTTVGLHRAVVDNDSSNSGILIGISRTSNPTNTGDAGWNSRRVKADSVSQRWADFPTLGFNKDWIVVQANMFFTSVNGGAFSRSHIYVFNKTNLYAGDFTSPTLFTNTVNAGSEFPAVTYDNSLSTLYLVQRVTGNFQGNGYMRIMSITGAVNSPVLNNAGTNPVYQVVNTTGTTGNRTTALISHRNWSCPSKFRTMTLGSATWFIAMVIFGSRTRFFCPQANPTHSAVQWWQLNPSLGVTQLGRIEDTTGTNFYAFPSIAVNRFNDVLVGFSRYSSNQYLSANYAFRAFNDSLNTMQTERAFKNGEDSYWKQQTNSTPNRNRWGDYSATCVDPVNDGDFWTVQEYSTPHVGSLVNFSGRWAVWWGNVTVTVPANDNFSSAITISGGQGTTNGTNIRATIESGEPNHAGNAGGASIWYNWTAPASGSVTIDTIGSTLDTLLAFIPAQASAA